MTPLGGQPTTSRAKRQQRLATNQLQNGLDLGIFDLENPMQKAQLVVLSLLEVQRMELVQPPGVPGVKRLSRQRRKCRHLTLLMVSSGKR